MRYNPKAIVYHFGHRNTRALLHRYFEYGRDIAVMCSGEKDYRKPGIYTPGVLAVLLILAVYLSMLNMATFLVLLVTAFILFTAFFNQRYRNAGGANLYKTPIFAAFDVTRRFVYLTGMAHGYIKTHRPWLIFHSI